jgi:hypothetical protein
MALTSHAHARSWAGGAAASDRGGQIPCRRKRRCFAGDPLGQAAEGPCCLATAAVVRARYSCSAEQ